MKKKKVNLILLILQVGFCCFSQQDSTFYYFQNTTPESPLIKIIAATEPGPLNDFYQLVLQSKRRESDSMFYYVNRIETENRLPQKLGPKFLYFKAFGYRISGNDSLSFKYHNSALDKAISLKDSMTELYALAALAQSYDYEDDNSYRLDFLNELNTKANQYNDQYNIDVSHFLKGNYYLFRDSSKAAIREYRKLINSESNVDASLLVGTYSNLGVLYNEVMDKPDSAEYFFKENLRVMDEQGYHASTSYFRTFNNLASALSNANRYNEAISYLKKADSLENKEYDLFRKSLIKENLAKNYEAIGNFKLAYENHKAFYNLEDSLNKREYSEAIAKFDNQGLRIKNLNLEAKDARKRSLLIVSGLIIIFGTVLFYVLQKSSKRKQKLAEQEKAIETQKLTNVLKEQELMAIDAMIEGQEKERLRIANDLHDDLGGLMATVKLHLSSLKKHAPQDDFKRTNTLLDEAYQKIRQIAHTKNSGVIAKQGLLKAIQKMAQMISASNKLHIEVIDYGLDSRLENSLELSVFRMVQELVTNIIKHAEATEASIHLTQHETALNIMIEDNGKGFNTKTKLNKNDGMGLHSIDKRVSYLDGTFTIESNPKEGTTIIIDIPI